MYERVSRDVPHSAFSLSVSDVKLEQRLFCVKWNVIFGCSFHSIKLRISSEVAFVNLYITVYFQLRYSLENLI